MCCGLTYKMSSKVVLTSPKRILLGLDIGLFASVKKSALSQARSMEECTIGHISSCAFLFKLTAIYRLVNEIIQGLFSALEPVDMTLIIPL